MIEWSVTLLLFAGSLLMGAGMTGLVPLRRTKGAWTVRLALAIGLSPFCLGLLTLVVLLLVPGVTPQVHLLLVLAGTAALVLALRRGVASMVSCQGDQKAHARPLVSVCVVATIAIGAVAILTPFTQNDALEYAWMGRLLYESGSLKVLPAVEPLANEYGVYLPWTHPPLYPALLYLASAVQGGTDTVGLGRCVSPWFLVAAVSCTFAAGLWNGARSAVLASLVLTFVPLLFLGTAAGLIDALPVSAFALLLAVVSWTGGSRWYRAAIAGAALGVALYTHSVAVLFMPLFAVAWAWRWGLHAPLRRLQEIGVAMLLALAIAIWPYLRNLAVLGVMVGDSPDVFHIQSQAWDDYFAIMRGIDHPVAVLQYGLLKGWFALEAYGATFWLMCFGLVSLANSGVWRRHSWLLSRNVRPWSRAVLVSVLLVGSYHGGVFVLALCGEEILIKNERYLLTVLPAVAVIVASLWSHGIGRSRRASATLHARLGRGLTLAAIAFQALLCLAFPIASMGGKKQGSGVSVPVELADPAIAPLWSVRQELAGSSGVLSMRLGDLYYVDARMVGALDPRLLPFYEATSADSGYAELQRLGVQHVHVPESHLPPVFNSPLASLLADPTRFTLISSGFGIQVFRIGDSGLRSRETTDFSPTVAHWTRRQQLIVGGRKALAYLELDRSPLPPDGWSIAPRLGGLFNRDRSVSVVSPVLVPGHCAEHLFHYTASGYGNVRIWLNVLSDVAGQASSDRYQIADFFLSQAQSRRSLASRVLLPSGTRQVALEFEHSGESRLHVESAELICLMRPQDWDVATRGT